MNQLSYKKKLAIFFVITFFPIIAYVAINFHDILNQRSVLKRKAIGLEYNFIFKKLLLNLPKHRGSTHAYLNGSKLFKDTILKIENRIDQDINQLLNIDKKYWNIYQNSTFIKDIKLSWDTLKLANLDKVDADTIYQKHTKLIKKILNQMNNLSHLIGIKDTQSAKLHDLEHYIYDKLPALAEYIGQARGLGVGILSKRSKTLKENKQSVFLYGVIKSNVDALDGIDIQVTNSVLEYLDTINTHIINTDTFLLDPKEFFLKGSLVINKVFDLHNQLTKQYQLDIYQQIDKFEKSIIKFIFSLLLILAILLYLVAAFYRSIMDGLKNLQEISLKIAKGEKDIQMYCNTNDELKDVYKAFDIMHHKIRENSAFLNSYKFAVDASSIVSKADTKGIITYANETFCTLSGYTKKELIGSPHNIVRHPDMPKEVFKQMWDRLKAKKVWKGIVKNRAKDGSAYFVSATIIPILDENDQIAEFIAVRHDVTELENKKEELKKQRIDILTGLYNRKQMLIDIENISNPVLVLININSFGELNDFYGNKIGDEVLIQVSKLLLQIAKQTDIKVYRLHADEFAFLTTSKSLSINSYKKFILQIINTIESNKIKCFNNEVIVTITIGIAFNEEKQEKDSLNLLIENANLALREAKSSNQKYAIYDHIMRDKSNYEENMRCVEAIKNAILNDQIVLYFQPIIDNKDLTIQKYESLVRLIKDDGSVISPFRFLDAARKAKIYTIITQIVIKKAFNIFYDLKKEFSINLTPDDIKDKSTVKLIKRLLKNFKEPNRVIFEILESEAINDYKVIENFIQEVKKYGAKIAIDDFGSGYSNFEHILSLDIDYLKIDGSLIKNIDKDENAKVITSAIIAFSKKLNRKTVVEFVHNKKVFEIVKELEADYSQGYYLGEPISTDQLLQKESKKELIHI